MTAHVDVAADQAKGPILVQGDQFGGMALLLDQSRPYFLYNPSGREEERVILRAPASLAPGSHDIQVRTITKAGATPRSATLVLSVDGSAAASVDVPVLYRVRGDVFIGRPGLGSLLAGQSVGELAGAAVRSVDINTSNTP
jgi:hypothetical protein